MATAAEGERCRNPETEIGEIVTLREVECMWCREILTPVIMWQEVFMKETKSLLSSNHWRQYFVSTSRKDTNGLRCLILFKLDFYLWLNLKMKGSSIGRLPVENSDRKFRRRIKNSFGKPTKPRRWRWPYTTMLQIQNTNTNTNTITNTNTALLSSNYDQLSHGQHCPAAS